ncbi:MAG: hypothetical protein HON70_11535 [Lentisphaerae bacterium]|nr:hypothetical protein [Lentisphaerota bacterium]
MRPVLRNTRVRIAIGLTALACAGGLGYRVGTRRAFIRDQRIANGPEMPEARPATWKPENRALSLPEHQEGKVTPQTEALAIDMTRPVRITWPLDVGLDPTPQEGSPSRLCLRARQGANELQEAGQGKAFYPFTAPEGGTYHTWFRVRWIDDGIGHIMCNNSWFAGFDDLPAEVIGNETDERDWFWQAGPDVTLTKGIHWLRVELREDGTLMDRAAIVPAQEKLPKSQLDAIVPSSLHTLAGHRIPLCPEHPIQNVEFHALPTESLVIGMNHVNMVALCASWQAPSTSATFSGQIQIHCPTAPGLTVQGTADVTCRAGSPFVRRELVLSFPPDSARRVHRTTISVNAEDGTPVFRKTIRFFSPPAWAFLGPFKDSSRGAKGVYRYTGTINRLGAACDATPRKLALRQTPAKLKLEGHPTTDGRATAWQLVSDGSCYDWSGAIDLRSVYGDERPAFAYAVTWLQAETKLNHRSFSFQADDAGWLWINGHTVAHLSMDLPREAHRLWTSGPLDKGPNPVVVKLTQNQRYWGFRLDVVDWHWQGRRGDVVTGIAPASWPSE